MNDNTIACPCCQTPIPVPNLDVSVVNNADLSLFYVTHEHGIECPKCLAYLKPVIVNLPPGIFGWVETERPADEPRVVRPNLVLAH